MMGPAIVIKITPMIIGQKSFLTGVTMRIDTPIRVRILANLSAYPVLNLENNRIAILVAGANPSVKMIVTRLAVVM